jgi:hypothetical protein
VTAIDAITNAIKNAAKFRYTLKPSFGSRVLHDDFTNCKKGETKRLKKNEYIPNSKLNAPNSSGEKLKAINLPDMSPTTPTRHCDNTRLTFFEWAP